MATSAKLEAAAAAVPHCKNWRREAPGDDSCADCVVRVIAFLLLEDQQTKQREQRRFMVRLVPDADDSPD